MKKNVLVNITNPSLATGREPQKASATRVLWKNAVFRDIRQDSLSKQIAFGSISTPKIITSKGFLLFTSDLFFYSCKLYSFTVLPVAMFKTVKRDVLPQSLAFQGKCICTHTQHMDCIYFIVEAFGDQIISQLYGSAS